MPTSIRVEDDVKRELDRLQGLIQSETGERLTHSALLARLVRIARQHERGLYADEKGPRWTSEAIRRRLDQLRVRGVRADVTRIDDELYGGEP